VPYYAYWITQIIGYAAVLPGIFAIVHSALQRADAFTAAGKLTKPGWVGINVGGTVCCLIFGFGSSFFMLWIAGLVAVLVYIVDVRPKLVEVQGGSKW
jgi:hypothetical protein